MDINLILLKTLLIAKFLKWLKLEFVLNVVKTVENTLYSIQINLQDIVVISYQI